MTSRMRDIKINDVIFPKSINTKTDSCLIACTDWQAAEFRQQLVVNPQITYNVN